MRFCVCPHCGHKSDLDAHDQLWGPTRLGDTPLCFACGRFAVVTADLSLRRPTLSEALGLKLSSSHWHRRRLWKELAHDDFAEMSGL
jgi:hypothetical protein